MSEASFETVLNELRASAPPAPERLHEQVRSLPATRPSRTLRFRPALGPAFVIAIAIAVAAGLIGGLNGSRETRSSDSVRASRSRSSATFKPQIERVPGVTLAPSLTARSRLQKQDVAMRLRVDDLSGATQSAVRTTRRLGGFVAGADYATDSKEGNSRLALRVPVANLQKAIAHFTQLGTILSQHISVADLQAGLDRLDARIASARRADKKRVVARLERRRDALRREGAYAKVALELTTKKPSAQPAAPGRFDRFRVNTGDILGKEAIAVLYALVVVGPFVLLATIILMAERTRRRRADRRLLEETG